MKNRPIVVGTNAFVCNRLLYSKFKIIGQANKRLESSYFQPKRQVCAFHTTQPAAFHLNAWWRGRRIWPGFSA